MSLPRIIHRIWIGSPLTDKQICCLVNARQYVSKDVELWLWTTQTSIPYLQHKNIIIRNINTLWPLLANTPLPQARLHSAFAREEAGGTYHNYAAVSDITRLLILYLYGGVYLDMDVSFKQNSSNLFDILTNIGQQLGILRFSMKNYGNCVLASMPRTDAVSMCLNKISELYTSSASITFSWGLKRGYGDYRMKLTVMLTGPQLIIDTLLAKGLLLPIDQSQHFQPIDVSGSSYKNYPGRQRHDSSP